MDKEHLSTQQNYWLQQNIDQITGEVNADFTISPMANDASNRRYFKISFATNKQVCLVACDHVCNLGFVNMSYQLQDNGIKVPDIIALQPTYEKIGDLRETCLLIQYLGDDLLLKQLSKKQSNTIKLYSKALDQIHQIQKANIDLEAYNNDSLADESNLFKEWFIPHLADNSQELIDLYDDMLPVLLHKISEQPVALLHRDYHSRNLLLHSKNNQQTLYTIDYQDALIGPITYDLVSLLKDCYIDIDENARQKLIADFYAKLPAKWQQGFAKFNNDFVLMGMQRHLKIAGIFVRLFVRDGKTNYLQHIDLCLKYLLDACNQFDFSQEFAKKLQTYKDGLATSLQNIQK